MNKELKAYDLVTVTKFEDGTDGVRWEPMMEDLLGRALIVLALQPTCRKKLSVWDQKNEKKWELPLSHVFPYEEEAEETQRIETIYRVDGREFNDLSLAEEYLKLLTMRKELCGAIEVSKTRKELLDTIKKFMRKEVTFIAREQAESVGACKKFLEFLGAGKTIAEICEEDVDWGIWCLRLLPNPERIQRLFAVWCARRVLHLAADSRSTEAVRVAECYAWGEATAAELRVAHVEADAWDASLYAVFYASKAVSSATFHAASHAAAYAATDATHIGYANDVAQYAADAAVTAVERCAQKAEVLRIFASVEAGEEPYEKPNWSK